MQSWKVLVVVGLTIVLSHCLAANNKDAFVVQGQHNHLLSFTLQRPTRVTIVQFHGHASVKVNTDRTVIFSGSQPYAQVELKQDYKNMDITVEISEGPAIGVILREVIDQYELISVGQQKMFDLAIKEPRIVEIHPRKFTTLKIQKFEGTVTFTNNRCLASEKQDCFYELQRIDANKMTKNIQKVHLDSCLSCIVLIKLESLTARTLIRMSIDTPLHILSTLSSVSLLKKGQQTSFVVYGQPQQEGKVIHYSGSVEIKSTVTTRSFQNGHMYQVPQQHKYSTPIQITLKGLDELNYVMIDGPSSANPLVLKDGLPESFEVRPNVTYIAKLDKKGVGRGNFVLAGNSSFLSQLYIRFINKELNLNYAVRPHFLFPVGHASQNFQLDNSTGIIELQIKNMGNKSGFLNASASLSEVLSLPLNWKQSNILEHRQSNSYVIDGLYGTVEIVVQKCVECYLQIGFGTEPQGIKEEEIKERVFRRTFTVNDGHLYVRLSTNNYAFYSIVVQNVSSSQPRARLEKQKAETYLTNPEEELELEFIGPKCGGQYCKQVQYYLIQGSDKQHVASRAYCPNALFDFDERTKDIVFEAIQPRQVNESHLSYVRALKHRQWILVVAKVGQQILSYDQINSGQIREYNTIRWPIFYLILFITFAIFMSFVIFMALNKPKGDAMGYLRGATAVSEQQIN